MADAAVETETITTGVTLYLTVEEAEALHDVAQHIGGHPRTSRRGLIDSIDNALVDTGLVKGYVSVKDDAEGSIRFDNTC